MKHESPKFLIFNERKDEAKKMLKQIYSPSENVEDIISQFQTFTQRDTSFISLKDAVSSDMYRKATWITLIIIIFHELTGINAIMLYSNTMFKKTGLENPRIGTYFLGIAGLLGLAIAILILKKIGRRTLLIGGHFIMAFCHALVGVFAFYNISLWVVVWMTAFILFY